MSYPQEFQSVGEVVKRLLELDQSKPIGFYWEGTANRIGIIVQDQASGLYMADVEEERVYS